MKTPVIKMTLHRDKSISAFYMGKKIDRITEAFDKIKDPAHAKLYMEAYRKISKHADSNVGYMTGYYGPKKMAELQKRFGVGHPIFGRSIPTAKQALKAGKKAVRR